MKRTIEAPELWKPEQAAEYLHTTANSLRQMRSRNQGPRYLKAGHRVLYRAEDVLNWLEERGGGAA